MYNIVNKSTIIFIWSSKFVLLLSDVLQSDFIAVTDNSHGRILQIDLKNGTVVKLPLSVKKPTGLAFDKSTMTFFYSDASEKAILSATLHGKNKKIFYATGTCYTLGL